MGASVIGREREGDSDDINDSHSNTLPHLVLSQPLLCKIKLDKSSSIISTDPPNTTKRHTCKSQLGPSFLLYPNNSSASRERECMQAEIVM